MANVMVRNIPDEVHRALRARATHHGRSTEAEIRDILNTAVRPENRVRLGSALAAIGRKYGLQDLMIERDVTLAEPVRFE